MRKILIPIFAVAVVAASCSKSNNDIQPAGEEIRMNVGVSSTKAPVISSGVAGIVSTDLDILFLRTDDGTTANWTTVGTAVQSTEGHGAGVIRATIEQATNNVKFKDFSTGVTETKQYYNSTGSNAYLVGFYPYTYSSGISELSTDAGATKATWSIDGQTDILISNVVNGNKSTANALAPKFDHQLTWIEFQIKGDAAAAAAWGQITGIEFVEAKTSASRLFNGSAATAYSGSGNVSTYITSTSSSLDWSGVQSTPTNITTGPVAYAQALVAPAAEDELAPSAANPPLPTLPERTYTVHVTTSSNPTGVYVPVTVTGGAEAGKKHIVTLTFSIAEIKATAVVTPWDTTTGGSGSGTVQ